MTELYRCPIPILDEDVEECDYEAEKPGSVKGHITSVHQGWSGPDIDVDDMPRLEIEGDDQDESTADGSDDEQAPAAGSDQQADTQDMVDQDEYEEQQRTLEGGQENNSGDGSDEDQDSAEGSDQQDADPSSDRAGTGLGIPTPSLPSGSTPWLVLAVVVIVIIALIYLRRRSSSSESSAEILAEGGEQADEQAENQAGRESGDSAAEEVTLIE